MLRAQQRNETKTSAERAPSGDNFLSPPAENLFTHLPYLLMLCARLKYLGRVRVWALWL